MWAERTYASHHVYRTNLQPSQTHHVYRTNMQPSEMHARRAEMHEKTPVKTSFLLFCSCACTKWTEMRTVRVHTAWVMQWCAEWPPTRHSRKIDGHFRAVCRLQSAVCRLESARCSLHGARCSSDRAHFAVQIAHILQFRSLPKYSCNRSLTLPHHS